MLGATLVSDSKTGAGAHLNGSVGQVHDDRLGGSDPPLDLGYCEAGTAGSHTSTSTSHGLHLPGLAALGEVLVHVLGEVPEEGELLVEGGGHLAAAHVGQVVALSELDIPGHRDTQ